jgi:hypothetical protein
MDTREEAIYVQKIVLPFENMNVYRAKPVCQSWLVRQSLWLRITYEEFKSSSRKERLCLHVSIHIKSVALVCEHKKQVLMASNMDMCLIMINIQLGQGDFMYLIFLIFPSILNN